MNGRKNRAVQAEAVHHLERPGPVDDVEYGSTRGVRYLACKLARQREADVVFRKKHFSDAFKMLRLMVAHPEKLRQGEACKHGVGREFQHLFLAHGGIDEIDLGLTALIAPDEGRTDDPMCSVEDHQAVHLPGESHAAHLVARYSSLRERTANRLDRGFGPVLRTLLGPQRMLHAHLFMGSGDGRDLLTVPVDEERARASRSDIYAEPVH